MMFVFFKTVIRIAAKINPLPIHPKVDNISLPIMNPNNAANTGSSVKIIAVWVGPICCWLQF
ncbi:hypothetical protein LCGC14_3038160, partial [marine sediment metagenome]